ncbi:hypothetical protein, partial [Pseudomonas mandelii]|uniref:hypothetical protein n=1 Tax=Pseudomonas mandelii TaxID=75612 RepID=UPI001C3D4F80
MVHFQYSVGGLSHHAFVAKRMGGSCTQVGEPEQSNRQTRRSPAHSRHNMHSFAGAKTPAWKRVAFALCCQVAKPDRHMGDGPEYKPR